jgi:hypothetical protein
MKNNNHCFHHASLSYFSVIFGINSTCSASMHECTHTHTWKKCNTINTIKFALTWFYVQYRNLASPVLVASVFGIVLLIPVLPSKRCIFYNPHASLSSFVIYILILQISCYQLHLLVRCGPNFFYFWDNLYNAARSIPDRGNGFFL